MSRILALSWGNELLKLAEFLGELPLAIVIRR